MICVVSQVKHRNAEEAAAETARLAEEQRIADEAEAATRAQEEAKQAELQAVATLPWTPRDDTEATVALEQLGFRSQRLATSTTSDEHKENAEKAAF